MLGSLIEHENEVQGIIPQPQIFPLCALEKNVSSLRSLAPVIIFNLCANKIQKAIANRPVHADKFYMSFLKKDSNTAELDYMARFAISAV